MEDPGAAGKSATTTPTSPISIEPKKDVQQFVWKIKDFVAVWKDGASSTEPKNLSYNFEIGQNVGKPTKMKVYLEPPTVVGEPSGHDPADDAHGSGCESTGNIDSVAVKLNHQKHLHEILLSIKMWILRTDLTKFKKFPESFLDPQLINQNLQTLSFPELLQPENKILEDGSLNLKFEVTFYSFRKRRRYRKRSLGAAAAEEANVKNLSDDLERMRKRGKHCDVRLQTNDGKVMEVHRNILEARSSVFETMFQSNSNLVLESADKQNESCICILKIEDISSPALEHLIKYLYTGRLEEDWLKYADELVNAAEKYGVRGIKDVGDVELIKSVTVKNAFERLHFAKHHELAIATRQIGEFIKANIDEILPNAEGNQNFEL